MVSIKSMTVSKRTGASWIAILILGASFLLLFINSYVKKNKKAKKPPNKTGSDKCKASDLISDSFNSSRR